MSAPLILQLQNRIKELENKSAILAYAKETQDLQVGVEVPVNIDTADEIKGSDLELSNNQITCKKSGFVAISYKIHLPSGQQNEANIISKIVQNNHEVSRVQYRPSGTRDQSYCSETRILKVEANDILKLTIINYSADCKIGSTSKSQSNSINVFYL